MTARGGLCAVVLAACGGTTAAPPDAIPADGYGSIRLYNQHTTTPASAIGFIAAAFQPPVCHYIQDGPCVTHQSCYAPPEIYYSVGEIDVSPVVPAGALSFPSMADADSSAGFQQSALIFDPGVALTVTASGDQLPGFAVTFETPSPIVITDPVSAFAFQRGSGFNIQWTGTSAGYVAIDLEQDTTSSDDITGVVCKFDASTGRATVPASALAVLDPTLTHVQFTSVDGATATSGSWQIAIDASFSAVFPDGSQAFIAHAGAE